VPPPLPPRPQPLTDCFGFFLFRFYDKLPPRPPKAKGLPNGGPRMTGVRDHGGGQSTHCGRAFERSPPPPTFCGVFPPPVPENPFRPRGRGARKLFILGVLCVSPFEGKLPTRWAEPWLVWSIPRPKGPPPKGPPSPVGFRWG